MPAVCLKKSYIQTPNCRLGASNTEDDLTSLPENNHLPPSFKNEDLTPTTPKSPLSNLSPMILKSELIAETETEIKPSAVSPPQIKSNEQKEYFYAIDSYEDKAGDGMSLKEGRKFEVLRRDNSNGWWYIKDDENNIEGWAPGAFLAVSIINLFKNLLTVKNIFKYIP